MLELRRYRLMPLDFNTGDHLLDPVGEGADPEVRAQAEENRNAQIDRLRYIHGEANLEAVIANIQALGADPFSTIGWHLHLWREVRHAFVSGAYFPAAVGAGAVAERVLNHLLIDLADDCATKADRRKIEAPKAPTYAVALEILNTTGGTSSSPPRQSSSSGCGLSATTSSTSTTVSTRIPGDAASKPSQSCAMHWTGSGASSCSAA